MPNPLRRRLAWLVVAPMLACAKPQAGGDYREISVLADDAVWATVESTLVRGLERTVLLLDEETVFWVHRVSLDRETTVRRRPHVLLLAASEERGPIADFVSAVLGKDIPTLATSSPFVRLKDPWAHGQAVYVVTAQTPSALDSVLGRACEVLYEDFLARYRERVRERLYVRGEDRARTEKLASRFGWILRVPRPWDVEEKPDERWVHFVKTDPDRHVSVYWEDWQDTTVSPEYCLRLRRALAWRHYDEDAIDESRTRYGWTRFQGRPALEITGAWVNEKYVAGGPFRTICFLVPEQRRLYLLDLVTFAPDRPKFYVMTQLGIIAETFAPVAGTGRRETSEHHSLSWRPHG